MSFVYSVSLHRNWDKKWYFDFYCCVVHRSYDGSINRVSKRNECLHPQFYFVYLFIYIRVFVSLPLYCVSHLLVCVCIHRKAQDLSRFSFRIQQHLQHRAKNFLSKCYRYRSNGTFSTLSPCLLKSALVCVCLSHKNALYKMRIHSAERSGHTNSCFLFYWERAHWLVVVVVFSWVFQYMFYISPRWCAHFNLFDCKYE